MTDLREGLAEWWSYDVDRTMELCQAEIARLTAERDAIAAAAFEAAADHCWNKRDRLADAEKKQIDAGLTGRDYYGRRLEAEMLSRSIRALTPADTKASLDRMLRQAKAEGMREAEALIREKWASTSAEHSDAILSRAKDMEAGNG